MSSPSRSQQPVAPADRFSIDNILEYLRSFIKGQDDALTILSVLLSMHMHWFGRRTTDHPSPNGLMIGPTGVGKTYTIQRAAEFLKIPFVVVDTTALVPAGIVGLQIEDVAEELVENAKALLTGRRLSATTRVTRANVEGETGVTAPVGDLVSTSSFVDDLRRTLVGDSAAPRIKAENRGSPSLTRDAIALAEKGIVFFDEFDKIAVSDPKERSSRDSAAQVQRRLLKFIEGAAVRVGVKQHTSTTRDDYLDTSGILCIASGAFSDMNDARRKRPHELARFRATAADDVIPQDLIEYGFMPELIARLPVLMRYGPLGVDALRQILSDVEQGPLRVWTDYYPEIGLELELDEAVAQTIAEYAFALKLGARGLSQILFPILAQLTSLARATGGTRVKLRIEQFLAHPTM
jgi:ATP-dependent protease Clp ATPase subunit